MNVFWGMRLMKQRKVSAAGFSIIELAMVILVGGIMIAAAGSMLISYLRALSVTTTQNRMQEIDNAIVHYVSINNSLPCAAALTDAQDSQTFGRQITDLPTNYIPPTIGYPGAPPDCNLAIGNANAINGTTGVFSSTGTNGFIVIGAVPVRDLDLPDQDIADAWGDRFVYAVTAAVANPDGYDPTQGSIKVTNNSGVSQASINNALYVIVSYGANRGGAYTISGAQGGVPCPVAPAPGYQNCAFTPAATNNFVKDIVTSDQTGVNAFDNYVIFRGPAGVAGGSTGLVMPSGFVAPFVNVATCPPGWLSYSGSACTPSVNYICCQKF
jgi:type II secretory pathway pseudopilin PulG